MKDIGRLLRPRSVAVVGGGFWCRNVLRKLRQIGFPGEVVAVHPRATVIEGVRAFPSVDALSFVPDAAFVGVNRAATVEVVAALSARGAGGAVCFASGFSEAAAEDPEGPRVEAELSAAAGGMPILGPNCYGLVNALDRVALWPDEHGLRPCARGVAIVTQSSNMAINLSMQARGLPIAMLATAGNQLMIDLADLAGAFAADPRITAIGLHVEGIRDLAGFEAMARAAGAAGKPVVVLKAGRSEAARVASVSHTASLAGSAAGASALFRRLGIAEAETLPVFLETLQLLHLFGPLETAEIASMSCSGGEAGLVADAAERIGGVAFPPLRAEQRTRLREVLGPRVALANPLDYHTYIWGDAGRMADVFCAVMEGPQALTLLVADLPRADRADPAAWDCIEAAARAARARTGRRLALVATLPENMPEALAERLAGDGIATLRGLDEALAAVRLAATRGLGRAVTAPPVTVPACRGPTRLLTEHAAKQWLSGFGLAIPPGREAATPAEAAAAADRIGYPVALKGLGAAHKTESGLVWLGLGSAEAVADAARAMDAAGYLVERMVEAPIAELLVGVLRDPAHGYVLTIGAGGVMTEILRDTVSLLVPAAPEDIDRALDGLKIAPVLRGWRGRPPVARAAVIEAVLAVQRAVLDDPARIEEIEINPLICTENGAVAADALARIGDER